MNLNPPQPDPHATPADLVALERSLSRLAMAERSTPAQGLEDRLMAASASALTGEHRAVAPGSRATAAGHDQPSIAGVIYRRASWRMRLAAAVMLTAGVAIAVLAVWGVKWTRPGAGTHGTNIASVGTPDASSDIDSMLAAVEALDTLLPFDAQIAGADATDSSLLSDVLKDWPASDDDQGVTQ